MRCAVLTEWLSPSLGPPLSHSTSRSFIRRWIHYLRCHVADALRNVNYGTAEADMNRRLLIMSADDIKERGAISKNSSVFPFLNHRPPVSLWVIAILSIHHLPSIAPSLWLLYTLSHMASSSPLCFVLCHAFGRWGEQAYGWFQSISGTPSPLLLLLHPSLCQTDTRSLFISISPQPSIPHLRQSPGADGCKIKVFNQLSTTPPLTSRPRIYCRARLKPPGARCFNDTDIQKPCHV